MNQEIDISVITVNYNGFNDTCELIDSWEAHIKSIRYEFIVVDNGSEFNEAELLKARYPHILAIRNEQNAGFAAGNNIGIKKARGNYLFFLNNDTVMPQDSLCHLIERLASSEHIAGVSPLIRGFNSPHSIQYAGYTPLTLITLRNKAIGEGELTKDLFPAGQTAYLHGAAMLIKKRIIDEIGLIPEDYFLYYEELDWCTMITRKGYQLWYDPRCEIWHKESKSIGLESPLKIYYQSRNRLLYAYRNRVGWSRTLAIVYQLLIACPKNIVKAYTKGEKEKAKAYLKGTKAFFKLKNIRL